MNSVLVPSRRRFLGLLGGLALAPAIIRAGVLMPINPALGAETFGPGGILTADMLAREMARQLRLAGSAPISRLLPAFGTSQSHVDFVHNTAELTWSLERYAAKYLRPAAYMMARAAPRTGAAPPLPFGVAFSAIGESRGVEVRFLRAYDINSDLYVTRADVSHG